MRRKPPAGVLAAAEQDYHTMRARMAEAVQGARLLLEGRDSEVEAFADVYWMLSRRTDAHIAAAMGAAAIMHLAKQSKDRQAG